MMVDWLANWLLCYAGLVYDEAVRHGVCNVREVFYVCLRLSRQYACGVEREPSSSGSRQHQHYHFICYSSRLIDAGSVEQYLETHINNNDSV